MKALARCKFWWPASTKTSRTRCRHAKLVKKIHPLLRQNLLPLNPLANGNEYT
ncbi:Hypothetical protein FKW44_006702 [Caligus rogercresseyi]|uniref:Uncharacterized protein n=1 Tax=Caligus rogercresseyi TaxID=217165 RepID=A0A7T8QT22_CALRO|nr:Hypothetical protein FKW44_006702 [Caligus rogercresseyi]